MKTLPMDLLGKIRPLGLTLKLLCLALACILWIMATALKRSESILELPLRLSNIPRGFRVASPLPAQVRVTLYGPQTMLRGAKQLNRTLVLDLGGAAAPGITNFAHLESRLRLPEEVRATRVTPALVELRLEAEHTSQGDRHQ